MPTRYDQHQQLRPVRSFANLYSGRIAWWNLNGNANDYYGLHNMTNNGAIPFVAGKIGTAADLEASGANQYFSRANMTAFDALTGLTVSAWIRPESLTTNNPIAEKWISSGDVETCWSSFLMATTGRARVLISANKDTDAGSNYVEMSSGGFAVGEWAHFAFTFAPATVLIYKNATAQATSATGTIPNLLTTSINETWAGHTFAGGSTFFDGVMDELGVWGRALAPWEIAQLYNGGRGISPPFGFKAA